MDSAMTSLKNLPLLGLLIGLLSNSLIAQENFTANGIADDRPDAIALTGASIYLPGGEWLVNGTVLMQQGKIVDIIAGTDVPADYFPIDMSRRYIYPGLIDINTSYGLPEPEKTTRSSGAENLFSSGRALNVNDAIRAHYRASLEFTPAEKQREELRKLGFSSVLSVRADGIARGTSALVTLGNENANESILVPDAAAHYSLDKGSSTQQMPVSLMGSVALLRQTYLDAEWFASQNPRPFTDESLEGLIRSQSLPQIMEVNNWHQVLTVDRVGKEFQQQYIIKTTNDAYQQAPLLAASGAALIVPVDFPEAPKVDDALDSDDISLAELKHWELAPFNLRMLHEQGITFALTATGNKSFWKNLRTAVNQGLPSDAAIAALTSVPAKMLGVESQLGQLIPGALANLVISSGPLFDKDSRLLENWIHGQRFVLESDFDERRGRYELTVDGRTWNIQLDFQNGIPKAEHVAGSEQTGEIQVDLSDNLISLNFTPAGAVGPVRLNGWPTDNGWQGSGQDAAGTYVAWQLELAGALLDEDSTDTGDTQLSSTEMPGKVIYPFTAYGSETAPERRDMVIRNATVWTNEDEGTLVTDVLVMGGKISAVGPGLTARNVLEIDGTGKHLTPGIIDEHTHIGVFAINETATNSSMVRMRDVINSENVDIYRNLAGGVVAAQILHGSANPIGGQSALIKMRWGQPPEGLLIQDADKFIKFALGENVKRSANTASIRYPQTRMGVEQVFVNAFTEAQGYGKRWDEYNRLSSNARRTAIKPRRDLVHEAMLEILNSDRYVTSHSYVQSEINMLMHVAESFDFNINTFTHILEGYKVADKMAKHGAGGSTFADWWAFKWEVRYAIPYNAALMLQAGVVVAINSDDAEMSRRLNQEAAKTVKYGGVSEQDALKMITLNPAKLLHLDDRMGSVRAGKDADLVLWSDHPLSIYARAETTWVDGIPFYDMARDQQLRQQISDERARIIAAINSKPADTDKNKTDETGVAQ